MQWQTRLLNSIQAGLPADCWGKFGFSVDRVTHGLLVCFVNGTPSARDKSYRCIFYRVHSYDNSLATQLKFWLHASLPICWMILCFVLTQNIVVLLSHSNSTCRRTTDFRQLSKRCHVKLLLLSVWLADFRTKSFLHSHRTTGPTKHSVTTMLGFYSY